MGKKSKRPHRNKYAGQAGTEAGGRYDSLKGADGVPLSSYARKMRDLPKFITSPAMTKHEPVAPPVPKAVPAMAAIEQPKPPRAVLSLPQQSSNVLFLSQAFKGGAKRTEVKHLATFPAMPRDMLEKECFLVLAGTKQALRFERHIGTFNEAAEWEGTSERAHLAPDISLRQAVNALRDWTYAVSPFAQGKDTQTVYPDARVLYWTSEVTNPELDALTK